MAYIIPQVLVFQEFQLAPQPLEEPLRAHVSGGNAELFRFDDADEKLLAALGPYDPLNDTDYLYPNKPTGGIVDQDYFKLFIDDALLQYFEDTVGAGSVIAPVAGFKNRVRSDAVNFADNGVSFPRDAALLDRDVQPGDVVDIRGVDGGDEYTLRTTVKALVGDETASTIGDPSADANNQAAVGADSCSISQNKGPYNCVDATCDAGSYDGTVEGDVVETYTVTVTDASVGGDLTTARLRVRTASGNDDHDDVIPSASGVATAIGDRGLTLTFTNTPGSCSLSAGSQGVSSEDLLAGQEWTVEVEQEFVVPDPSSGGTFTGDFDTSYIVTVSRGGDASASATADKPQIMVSTIHGVDVSGPTTVTAAGQAIVVGTLGVTITFDVPILRKNDIWYIAVTGVGSGNIRTIVLNNNLPTELLGVADLDLTLYIKPADGWIEVPRKRLGFAPTVNWELGDPGLQDSGFTVNSGIIAYDASWTDSGVEQPLDVAEGNLFAHYRAWLSDWCDNVGTISDVANIDDIPGPLHPDNVLKWGVFKALSNSNGVAVKYTAVCDPSDLDSWADVLEVVLGRTDLHGLVPLTTWKAVQDLYAAHVDSQSSPEAGRWRVLWTALSAEPTIAIIDDESTSDEEVALATISDDPDVSGNQFTIVDVPAGNAQFVTNDVRPGDIVRINFTTDGWDEELYDEYVVDVVLNEDSLRLTSGPGAAIGVAKKMEIWRNLNATDLSQQIADKAAAFGQQRIRAIWPDEAGSGGETFPGYHVAAALAGLRSGVLPNQGLTNVEVAGFDDVTRSHELFNKAQLDTMAEAGVWIVTKTDDGNIITRHALTTAGYGDVLLGEEMVNANVDSMSVVFLRSLEDLIGRSNVTPGTIEIVEVRLEGVISRFEQVFFQRLGGQLINGEVLEVRQHTLLKDRLVANLQLTVPVPLNNLEVHLQIVA